MATGAQASSLTPAARAILDAAGHLFYERGLNAVGVDTVAAEAGTTKKTLYDQFGSKAALAVAYLTERDQAYRSWVQDAVAERSGPDRILAVFDALSQLEGAAVLRSISAIPDAVTESRNAANVLLSAHGASTPSPRSS